jgi:hypothetical protein
LTFVSARRKIVAMSDHEHTEPEPDERDDTVEDLEAPQDQQEDVAGGFLKVNRPDKG